MARINYPEFAKDRGLAYWMRPGNFWAARRKIFRSDRSIEWRCAFPSEEIPEAYRDICGPRSTPFTTLMARDEDNKSDFRFIMLGDTGEGDCSQFATIPLIRALKPDFLIINGDIAYPAGRIGNDRNTDDYLAGFFEPYRDLGIPIWTVPGNHEYYPDWKGREYFDIYCTRKYDDRWDDYGLVHVPQPGTYWELRDPDLKNDLVVIGIDSGGAGNLDGHNAFWQVWKSKVPADGEQHNWLRQRLESAERNGHRVIVMFHIPALANQKYKEEHLTTLHKILAHYSCVRLVVAGHEHNYQRYSRDMFARFLRESIKATDNRDSAIEFMVSGGGGAYLTTTDFTNKSYPCDTAYPSIDQWKKLAGFWRRSVERSPFAKSAGGRMTRFIDKSPEYDADDPRFLSMLLVTVQRHLEANDGQEPTRSNIRVTPVWLDDIQDLYAHLDQDEAIDVTARVVDKQVVVAAERCLKSDSKQMVEF